MSPACSNAHAAQPPWSLDGLVVCSACHKETIQCSDDRYVCPACSTLFPFCDSVLNTLFSDPESHDRRDPAPVARAIMTRYGIPDDPATLERVVKLIVDSQNAPVTGSTGAEIQHFVERFNLQNIDCEFEIIRHYVEAVLPRGTVLHRSSRLRNNGDFSWSSKGSQPVLVSYHWLDHQGHVIHFEGH